MNNGRKILNVLERQVLRDQDQCRRHVLKHRRHCHQVQHLRRVHQSQNHHRIGPWLQKIMSRSGYFKDLGNFGQQILNQVASDIRSNAENLVFSFGQEGSQQNPQRNNSENQGSDQPSSKTSRSEASTPSGGSSRTPPGGPPRARRSSSASSSQATTPDEVAGDWLNSVS